MPIGPSVQEMIGYWVGSRLEVYVRICICYIRISKKNDKGHRREFWCIYLCSRTGCFAKLNCQLVDLEPLVKASTCLIYLGYLIE